jgi:4'-phosphopantetheinyl transferase EntD
MPARGSTLHGRGIEPMLLLAAARIDDVLTRAGCGANELPALFDDAERARWTALAPSGRAAFVASRLLMRSLLERTTGVAQGKWTLSAQPGRAPIALRQAGIPGFEDDCLPSISMSHRLGWVCAATGRGSLGVDIEVERPPRSDLAERAALMLAPEELSMWNGLAAHARESALLIFWTVKEAWFKASPPETAPWDFRRVIARACVPARANVRAWSAAPVHVAVCCPCASDLFDAPCEGLATAAVTSSFWNVGRAASLA